MFNVWSGYSCLSASIMRKCWLPWGGHAIYPNIYVMLVGDAGNGKTWAMDKARRLMVLVPDLTEQISASVETPQAWIKAMVGAPDEKPPRPAFGKFPAKWYDGVVRDSHCAIIMANEFINYISLMPPEWINVLNDIYDRDYYPYRTLNQGTINVTGPYVTMLAALTTEISNDLQKTKIISTGLARRTLFQYGERRWNNPCPEPTFTDEQMAAKLRCIEYLKGLKSVAGEFSWGVGTKEWWREWYVPHLAAVPQKSPTTKSWYASKNVQLLKLTMLTALSEGGPLEITVPHFEVALEQLSNLELDLDKIFGGVGRNELGSVAQKMCEFVHALPVPVSMRQMRQNFFTSCRPPHDFDFCINHLIDSGQCIRYNGVIVSSKTFVDLIGSPTSMADFFLKQQLPPPTALSGSQSGPTDATDPSTEP